MKSNLEKIGIVAVITGIIISLWFSVDAQNKSKEANKIARNANNIAESLFLVANRPYIDFDIVKLDSGAYLEVNDEAMTFHIDLKNIGEIPAKNIDIEIYFLNNEDYVYENLSIQMPDSQKLFKDDTQTLKPSIIIEDTKNQSMLDAISSRRLRLGVVVSYKSDLNESESYVTKKIFKLEEDSVKLIGTLGNFE